jgi:hypothetical protein
MKFGKEEDQIFFANLEKILRPELLKSAEEILQERIRILSLIQKDLEESVAYQRRSQRFFQRIWKKFLERTLSFPESCRRDSSVRLGDS